MPPSMRGTIPIPFPGSTQRSGAVFMRPRAQARLPNGRGTRPQDSGHFDAGHENSYNTQTAACPRPDTYEAVLEISAMTQTHDHDPEDLYEPFRVLSFPKWGIFGYAHPYTEIIVYPAGLAAVIFGTTIAFLIMLDGFMMRSEERRVGAERR